METKRTCAGRGLGSYGGWDGTGAAEPSEGEMDRAATPAWDGTLEEVRVGVLSPRTPPRKPGDEDLILTPLPPRRSEEEIAALMAAHPDLAYDDELDEWYELADLEADDEETVRLEDCEAYKDYLVRTSPEEREELGRQLREELGLV